MSPERSSVRADDVDVVEELTLDSLEDENVHVFDLVKLVLIMGLLVWRVFNDHLRARIVALWPIGSNVHVLV